MATFESELLTINSRIKETELRIKKLDEKERELMSEISRFDSKIKDAHKKIIETERDFQKIEDLKHAHVAEHEKLTREKSELSLNVVKLNRHASDISKKIADENKRNREHKMNLR